MFDLFRSRDKAVRYVLGALLGLVALSLVVTLIPGYGTPSAAPETILAEVDDEAITAQEVQATIQNVVRNRSVPPEALEFYVPQIIDQIIAERAVAYQARRMGFEATDAEVASDIRQMLGPVFQNGQFDKQAYAQILAQQGMTIPAFESKVRSEILMRKLQNLATEGVIVTPAEVEAEFRRRNEKIKVDYIQYSPGDLRSEVSVTPEEVKTYFDKNRSQFMIPEKRSFELLLADEAKIGASLEITDAELRKAYEGSMDRFRTPERVKVRHILLTTTGKSAEEVAKIEAQIKDLLKQIKAGANFAELAKKHSQDPGSASQGGDLGWVTRGQMVKNFEETSFSLKPNEISDVIKTEYGFHIVQALEKEEARLRPFEEVKAELLTERRRQFIYDRMQTAVEQARSELAQNPQQAAEIAKKYNLIHASVQNHSGQEPIPEVGASAEVQNALAAVKAGEVTQVFQIGANKLGVAALTNFEPARQAEFEQVRNDVRDAVTNQKAQELSQKRVEEAVQKLKAAGQDFKKAAQAMKLPVKTTSDAFNREAAAEGIGPATYFIDAFTKPVGTVLDPVTMGNQVFLIRVAEKTPVDMNQLAAERQSILNSLKQKKAQERRELFQDGLLTQLIKEGKVKKYPDNIRRLSGTYQG